MIKFKWTYLFLYLLLFLSFNSCKREIQIKETPMLYSGQDPLIHAAISDIKKSGSLSSFYSSSSELYQFDWDKSIYKGTIGKDLKTQIVVPHINNQGVIDGYLHADLDKNSRVISYQVHDTGDTELSMLKEYYTSKGYNFEKNNIRTSKNIQIRPILSSKEQLSLNDLIGGNRREVSSTQNILTPTIDNTVDGNCVFAFNFSYLYELNPVRDCTPWDIFQRMQDQFVQSFVSNLNGNQTLRIEYDHIIVEGQGLSDAGIRTNITISLQYMQSLNYACVNYIRLGDIRLSGNCAGTGGGNGENDGSSGGHVTTIITNNLTDPCMYKTTQEVIAASYKLEGIMSTIIKNFNNENSVQININNADIYDDQGRDKPGQTSDQVITKNIFRATITLGTAYHQGTSKENMVTSLIHEVLHAYLTYTGDNTINTTGDHNIISDKYITPMATYLQVYFQIPLKDAYALAWSGVSDSRVYQDASLDYGFKMYDGNTITKLETAVLSSYYKDLNTESTSKGEPICL